jgi:hypothetical protein
VSEVEGLVGLELYQEIQMFHINHLLWATVGRVSFQEALTVVKTVSTNSQVPITTNNNNLSKTLSRPT